MTMQSRQNVRLLVVLTLSIWSQVATAQLIRPTTQEEITRRLQVPPDNFDDQQALLSVILDRHPVPDLIAPHLDGDWAAEATIAYLAAGGSEAVIAGVLRRDIEEGFPFPDRTLYLAITLLNSPEFGPLARKTLIANLLDSDAGHFIDTDWVSCFRHEQARKLILDLLRELPSHDIPEDEEQVLRLEVLSPQIGLEFFPLIRPLLDDRQNWLRQLAAHWLICGDFDDLPMAQVRQLLDHAGPYHSLAGATLTLRKQPENSRARDVLLQALASDDSEFRTLAIISAGTLADQDPEWFGRLLRMLLNADAATSKTLVPVIDRSLPRHEELLAQFLQKNLNRFEPPLRNDLTGQIWGDHAGPEVIQFWEMVLTNPELGVSGEVLLRLRHSESSLPNNFELLYPYLSSKNPDEQDRSADLLAELELTETQKSQLLLRADDLLGIPANPPDSPRIVNESIARMYWKQDLEQPRIREFQRQLLASNQDGFLEKGLRLTRITRSVDEDQNPALLKQTERKPWDWIRIAHHQWAFGSGFQNLLLKMLKEDDANNRVIAVRLLSAMQPSQLVLEGLLPLLDDPRVSVLEPQAVSRRNRVNELAASHVAELIFKSPELAIHLASRPDVLLKLRPLLKDEEWGWITSPRPTFEEIKSGSRPPTYWELKIVLDEYRSDSPFRRKHNSLELSSALLKEFLSQSRRLRGSGVDLPDDGAMDILHAVGESQNPPPELLEEMNLWLTECRFLDDDDAFWIAEALLRHQPDNTVARKVIQLEQRRYDRSELE